MTILVQFVLKPKHLISEEDTILASDKNTASIDHMRQRDILKSKAFLLLAPNVFFMSFAITGLFFYQLPIIDFKEWNVEIIASGLPVFAIASTISILYSGPLIDKYSEKAFFPFYLLPFFIALVVIWWVPWS